MYAIRSYYGLKPMAEMPPLRAGLSTTVEIDTGHRRRLLGLTL